LGEAGLIYAAGRALALAQGEETALPCPWPIPWDKDAPVPHMAAAPSFSTSPR
jgi:hypothetical protein